MNNIKQNHPFHLTTLSPWPLLMSFSLMNTLVSFNNFFHLKFCTPLVMNLTISLIISMLWWNNIIKESLFTGNHNFTITGLLKLGMIFFITSELMFFVSFFWTYFHLSLSPSIEIGAAWPPVGINLFNPYNVPLLNTLILLSSGISITWAHHSIINLQQNQSVNSLLLTVCLGFYFSYWQLNEYLNSFFSMNDCSFSSIFFMATGFHGLHVLIGTLFNLINLLRLNSNQFSNFHHCGFELSAWYWHFVDVIWLFLYLVIYWWPY
uniref:Cytochrome c oxidase subunit 3 n=2 Tax=unclassified Megaspilidae TaxID=1253067 RepID=A0A3S8V0Y8_9HYME|nr:cytochrome c oxidase subunit III [Megaspilidae sp. SJW-2015]AZL93338.1 cytochrome c oxidase subunit 3 [Megaspilidae sp. ZJUH_2016022]